MNLKPLPFYICALILISVLPINGSGSSINHSFIIHLRLDYFFHGLVFIPFMMIGRIERIKFKRQTSNVKRQFAIVRRQTPNLKFFTFHFSLFTFLFLAGLFFAILCESIQYPLPYRTFNINDLIANAVGVVIGIPFFFLV